MSLLELKTILVVDGSPLARSLMAHLLRPYCREVVELSSAEEAMVALSRPESVSLAIVDAGVDGGGWAWCGVEGGWGLGHVVLPHAA